MKKLKALKAVVLVIASIVLFAAGLTILNLALPGLKKFIDLHLFEMAAEGFPASTAFQIWLGSTALNAALALFTGRNYTANQQRSLFVEILYGSLAIIASVAGFLAVSTIMKPLFALTMVGLANCVFEVVLILTLESATYKWLGNSEENSLTNAGLHAN